MWAALRAHAASLGARRAMTPAPAALTPPTAGATRGMGAIAPTAGAGRPHRWSCRRALHPCWASMPSSSPAVRRTRQPAPVPQRYLAGLRSANRRCSACLRAATRGTQGYTRRAPQAAIGRGMRCTGKACCPQQDTSSQRGRAAGAPPPMQQPPLRSCRGSSIGPDGPAELQAADTLRHHRREGATRRINTAATCAGVGQVPADAEKDDGAEGGPIPVTLMSSLPNPLTASIALMAAITLVFAAFGVMRRREKTQLGATGARDFASVSLDGEHKGQHLLPVPQASPQVPQARMATTPAPHGPAWGDAIPRLRHRLLHLLEGDARVRRACRRALRPPAAPGWSAR